MDQRHFRQLTKELGVTIQERQEICRILQEDDYAAPFPLKGSRHGHVQSYTLFQVTWVNSSGQGCIIPYPAISLHAVSRDMTAFPHQCLYLMIDGKLMTEVQQVDKEGGGQGDAGGQQTEEEEEALGAVRELRFVPDKNESLGSMFDAMTDCQVLHPDPEDEDSDGGEEYDDAEEGEEEEEIGHPDANQGNIVIVPSSINGASTTDQHKDEPMDTGQFDDADIDPPTQ